MSAPPLSLSRVAMICALVEPVWTISGSDVVVMVLRLRSLVQPMSLSSPSKSAVNMTAGSFLMFLSFGYCAARPCSVLSLDGVCAVAHDVAIVISTIASNVVIRFIL